MAWVHPDDIAFAKFLTRRAFNKMKENTSLSKTDGLIFEIPGVREKYVEHVKEYQKSDSTFTILEKVVDTFAERYPHVAYARSIPIVNNASIVFVAWPPQVTLVSSRPRIHTSSYITVSFIPTKLRSGKYHAPLIARFFYTSVYHYVMTGHFKKYILSKPMLRKLYENKYEQYYTRFYEEEVKKHKRIDKKTKARIESHARKIARREAVRVLIGNTWLINMYYLVETENLDPDEIELPYHVAANPELHKTMLNPIDTIDEYRLRMNGYIDLAKDIKYITWKWLIQRTLKSNNENPRTNLSNIAVSRTT